MIFWLILLSDCTVLLFYMWDKDNRFNRTLVFYCAEFVGHIEAFYNLIHSRVNPVPKLEEEKEEVNVLLWRPQELLSQCSRISCLHVKLIWTVESGFPNISCAWTSKFHLLDWTVNFRWFQNVLFHIIVQMKNKTFYLKSWFFTCLLLYLN